MKKLSLRVLCACFVVAVGWISAAAQALNPAGIVKMDPAFDTIVSPDTKLEMLNAEGFEGGEGPVWVQEGKAGHLLFSDVPGNRTYKWTPECFNYPCQTGGKLSIFLEHSGTKEASPAPAADNSGPRVSMGANGLSLDRQGRLLLAATGDRAIDRLEKDGSRTILADRYDGKRFSCPNDLVAKSDGSVYFTDGAAGCLRGRQDSREELPFHGVFFAKNGKVELLDKDPGGLPPNGIALSPDQKILYVTNGGPAPEQRKIIAYDVQSDGTVKNSRVFLDLTGEKGLGGPDGVKVDRKGNVYAAATGGLWIVSPAGKRLGLIRAPEGIRFANLAFGDPDSKTLYLVSAKNLWRVRLNIPGVRP